LSQTSIGFDAPVIFLYRSYDHNLLNVFKMFKRHPFYILPSIKCLKDVMVPTGFLHWSESIDWSTIQYVSNKIKQRQRISFISVLFYWIHCINQIVFVVRNGAN